MDEHKKVIAARRGEINKRLADIPGRIDENIRLLPDVIGLDRARMTAEIAGLKAKKEERQQELSRIQSGGEIAEKRRQVAECETELIKIKNEHQSVVGEEIDTKRGENGAISRTISSLQQEVSERQALIKRNKTKIAIGENEAEKLRKEWHSVNDKQFEIFIAPVCPACGQDLPEEQLASAREKAEDAFNLEKAKGLEAISAKGKQLKTDIEILRDDNISLENSITDAQGQIDDLEQQSANLVIQIDALMQTSRDITEYPSYVQKLTEKSNLEADIAHLQQNSQAAADAVKHKIADFDLALNDLDADLKKLDDRKKGEKRIDELKAEEKNLAAEYAKLEGELYLCEQFTRAKVALLDKKINSRFKYARFKMFKEQINGGLEECCETLYGGVPYSEGLNRGHRIIVGMDIICTLSEHYGIEVPIFVDNAEAVTKLPEMSAQVIRLVKPDMEPPKPEGMPDDAYMTMCEQLRKKYSKLVVNVLPEKKELREAV
jgi:hypothetical protein